MSESAQDAGAPFERFRFDGSDGDELAASRTLVPEPNPTMLRRLAERVAASHYTGYSVDRQKLLAWADEIEAAADRVVPLPPEQNENCESAITGVGGAPLRCSLPNLHAGWHRDENGTEWLASGINGPRYVTRNEPAAPVSLPEDPDLDTIEERADAWLSPSHVPAVFRHDVVGLVVDLVAEVRRLRLEIESCQKSAGAQR